VMMTASPSNLSLARITAFGVISNPTGGSVVDLSRSPDAG
jgi:hypothetical protein